MNYFLLFFQYMNYFSWSHGPLYTLHYCLYNRWPKVHINKSRNFQLIKHFTQFASSYFPYVAISLSKRNQHVTLLLQPHILVFSSHFLLNLPLSHSNVSSSSPISLSLFFFLLLLPCLLPSFTIPMSSIMFKESEEGKRQEERNNSKGGQLGKPGPLYLG